MPLKQVSLNSRGWNCRVDGVEKTVDQREGVPATFDDGSTAKTVGGVGTYTSSTRWNSNICPRKSFVGTAPSVTVVREDKNKASATYTNSNSC